MGGGIGAARVNGGKQSMCLDLKSADGQRVARQLIARADVLVHNYRVGVPERLGIGYADARACNEKLVYVTVNGYGPEGPGALRPSTHPIPGAALGGVTFQLGGELPREVLKGQALRDAARRISRANELNPDPNTSMVVATAVTLGLAAVARCGVGQQVFVDMFGANAYANFDDFCAFDGKPPRRQPDASGHGLAPHQRLYQCADGWLYVSCDEGTWTRAAHALALARENSFRSHDVAWWIATLAARGVTCVRADAGLPAQYLLSAGAAERLVVRATSSEWGDYLRPAPQLEFAGVVDHGGACRAGEHTEAIFRELGNGAA
jgi:crotonobetainyl-CoA:carnitine CoA-transferase CaiB-like acyl-CoA transferase